MSKDRFQVTLNKSLVAQARRIMAQRGFDSLSEFLESLIRDEADRRDLPSTPARAPAGDRSAISLNEPAEPYKIKRK